MGVVPQVLFFLVIAVGFPIPLPPVNLVQEEQARGRAVGSGFVADRPEMGFRAVLRPHARPVRLQVELVAAGAPGPSRLTAPEARARRGASEVLAVGLAAGSYRWKARAVDDRGSASPWVEFDPAPGAHFAVEPGPGFEECAGFLP